MTDEQIVRALECCGNMNECKKECPLDDLGGIDKCIHTLMLNALDLIKRQQAEIERLHEVINDFEEQSHKELMDYMQLSEKYENARAEAVREFAERLIKLLKQAEKQQSLNAVCGDIDSLIDSPRGAEFIADYLLENGAVVLPCKVGDVVYIIDEGDECTEPYVLDVTVTTIGYDIGGFWITMDLPLGFKMSAHIGERSFGKTVFLTREEAERALKGETK